MTQQLTRGGIALWIGLLASCWLGCGSASPDADDTGDNGDTHDESSDSESASEQDTDKGPCPWTCLTTKGCDAQEGTVMPGFTCSYAAQICCRPEGDTSTGPSASDSSTATGQDTSTTETDTGSATDTNKPLCSYTCRTATTCASMGGTVHSDMSCSQSGRVCCEGGGTTTATDTGSDSNVPCESMGIDVNGALQTNVSSVTFNSASVSLSHKVDIDEFEDGCISELSVELYNNVGGNSGCHLTLSTASQYLWDGFWAWEGGLAIYSLAFTADSYCPGFPDEDEGYYSTGYGDLWVAEAVLGVEDISQNMADRACVATTITLRLEGTLGDYYGNTLSIEPTEIVLSGGFISYGSTGNSCPCRPTCDTYSFCSDYDGCGYAFTCGDCDHPEDGDTDATDTWCSGYTGTNYCCFNSDPCGYANDNMCDCSGYCAWDYYDCYYK